ncbi:MAG TPA: hypothetical protein VHA52_08480 [Candidatus Babeliaceae bacterium]|nr:hypothetical protein [Candidatus Babeliaceae bacterium]
MSLPANFGKPPGEEPHRAFRNTCIEFKKMIKTSQDPDVLQQEMQKLIDESKQMDWHNKTSGVYHKPEGEKLIAKLYAEFKRYTLNLIEAPMDANPSDLLDALTLLEQYVRSFKVT